MKNNKAIILAAGRGMRLGNLTNDKPKCMVKYKGKRIIDHQVDIFHEFGITDITVITGYKGEKIDRNDVNFITNPNYNITNMVYTLFCAESIMKGNIIISYGDIVYKSKVLQTLIDSKHDFAVIVDRCWRELWEKRMPDPLSDAETMKIDNKKRIIELGKKTDSYKDINGQYIGLIKISERIIDNVINFYHSLDKNRLYDGKDFNNMYMTSFIQSLIDNNMPVYAVFIDGGWIEIDNESDLAIDILE